ncbi:MAG: hypothetical protein RLZZ631_1829 [Cyanobacteriota bacterium]
MSASRPTNTSRAYWELKAEQVMDRVFSNTSRSAPTQLQSPQAAPAAQSDQEPIEVEVRDAAGPWQRPWQIAGLTLPPRLAIGLAAGLGCFSLVAGFSLWQGWNEARNDLRQERNLRLLEGIRNLETAEQPGGPATPTSSSDGLPPPPPNEPWIQELGQLESSSSGGAAPLQVPLNGTLQTPAPPAAPVSTISSSASSSAATPELLGVVQIPGKPGSAIFQVGSSSTNALVGESIGSSGWRLVSTSGDSAVIERGGISRRVSISSGF